MRDNEIREAGALLGIGLREVSRGVQRVHGAIAGRIRHVLATAVGVPVAASGRAGPVTELTYAAVGLGLVGAGHVGGHLVARRRADDRAAGDTADRLLAAVNGSHGHLLEARRSPLTLAASVRAFGSDVTLTPAGVRGVWPAPTPELAVYVHGLVDTERRWQVERPRGDCGNGEPDSEAAISSLPELLESGLGRTPVFVRYNSGRRVEDSARAVSAVLQDLVRAWPGEVTRIVLIGHSMGGLVCRLALSRAEQEEAGSDDARWWPLVTDLVSVGTPHGGAWLEQAVGRWSPYLAKWPETAWFGEQLDLRSDGIRDLAGPVGGPSYVSALPPRVREHAIVGTVTGEAGGALGRRVGDLMVGVESASGGLPADAVEILPGAHHLALTRDPRVGRKLVRRLGSAASEHR